MARDGCCALAVQPEFIACFGADGNKALTTTAVCQAHHLGAYLRHPVGVVTGNVADQHHLRQARAFAHRTARLGGIPYGLQVAVVQMLQSGEQHTGALLLGKHEVDDVHDAGYRISGIAEKLQAHGAYMRRHAVHHPARARHQAVATFLLDARQAAEELVGHILAQALLAKTAARNIQSLGPRQGSAVGGEITQFERGQFRVMDLAQVVVDTCHFHPGGLGCHHAPGHQVVQRRAPQHGLFAAGVHGDVAADTGSLGRCRVYCEHESGSLSGVGHSLRDHAGFGPDGGNRLGEAWKVHQGDLAHRFQLLGIDDCALPGQRTRATGVTCATAARDHGQSKINTSLNQARHFGLGVRCEHHERVLNAPVRRVGNVRHTAQAIELDVVFGRQPAELPQAASAQ